MAQTYQRYGIFFTPTDALAAAGAQWLGWDLATGQHVGTPNLSHVKRPQKYGFHATIKPPFYLAFEKLCADLTPVALAGLSPACIGGFVALIPTGTLDPLAALAGRVVSDLDMFRAPPSETELARRRQSRLTHVQEAYLIKWGYPYVFDQFKFHMTLSGSLKGNALDPALELARSVFSPVVPSPFIIDALSLVGERSDGMFELIERRTLGAATS
jgi:hypothetical protein